LDGQKIALEDPPVFLHLSDSVTIKAAAIIPRPLIFAKLLVENFSVLAFDANFTSEGNITLLPHFCQSIGPKFLPILPPIQQVLTLFLRIIIST
jgi:hypothetical protein